MKSGTKLHFAFLWIALFATVIGQGYAARNGSGTYTVPNSFTPNSTISSADFNENFTDLATEITNSVAADGQTTLTGAIKGANGTVSAPAYSFASDLDSGMYRIGANNIGLAVNGTKIVDVGTAGATIVGAVSATSVDATTIKQGTYTLVPPGITVAYAGSAAPDGWLLSYGQAVSRETYANLFTNISTVYGTGDGSTTFNLPDCRGRVIAGKDDMGGSSANRLTNQTGGLNGDTLGATGGAETHTLLEAQLPAITPAGTITLDTLTLYRKQSVGGSGSINNILSGANQSDGTVSATLPSAATLTFTGTPFGSGDAHNNVQPTIIMNCIIKF